MDSLINIVALVASFAIVSFASDWGQDFIARKSDDRTMPVAAILIALVAGPIILSNLGTIFFGQLVGSVCFIGALFGSLWGALKETPLRKGLSNWWSN